MMTKENEEIMFGHIDRRGSTFDNLIIAETWIAGRSRDPLS